MDPNAPMGNTPMDDQNPAPVEEGGAEETGMPMPEEGGEGAADENV